VSLVARAVDHELLRAGGLHIAELTLDGILGQPLLAGLLPQVESFALELHDLWIARGPPSRVPSLIVAGGEHQLHLGDRGNVELAVDDDTHDVTTPAFGECKVSGRLLLTRWQRPVILVLGPDYGPQVVVFLQIECNEVTVS
jgi:hypothetical protein